MTGKKLKDAIANGTCAYTMIPVNYACTRQLKEECKRRKIRGFSGLHLQQLRDFVKAQGIEYIQIPRLPIPTPTGDRPGLSNLQPDTLYYITLS